MNIVVYYHTYLDDYFLWSQLLLEKFKAMEDSGLKDKIKLMKITVITQNDDRIKLFHEMCRLANIPMEIEFVLNQYPNDQAMIGDLHDIFTNNSKNIVETYTQRKMYNDCLKEDNIVLYLHAKGSSSILNNLMTGLVSKYRNRYYWRHFMYKTITEWKACVDALQNGYDTAGVDFKSEPTNHYRGNFFWTKSEHVRKLAPPDTTEWWVDLKTKLNDPWLNSVNDRFAAEMWVCSIPATKSFNVVSNNGDYIENDT